METVFLTKHTTAGLRKPAPKDDYNILAPSRGAEADPFGIKHKEDKNSPLRSKTKTLKRERTPRAKLSLQQRQGGKATSLEGIFINHGPPVSNQPHASANFDLLAPGRGVDADPFGLRHREDKTNMATKKFVDGTRGRPRPLTPDNPYKPDKKEYKTSFEQIYINAEKPGKVSLVRRDFDIVAPHRQDEPDLFGIRHRENKNSPLRTMTRTMAKSQSPPKRKERGRGQGIEEIFLKEAKGARMASHKEADFDIIAPERTDEADIFGLKHREDRKDPVKAGWKDKTRTMPRVQTPKTLQKKGTHALSHEDIYINNRSIKTPRPEVRDFDIIAPERTDSADLFGIKHKEDTNSPLRMRTKTLPRPQTTEPQRRSRKDNHRNWTFEKHFMESKPARIENLHNKRRTYDIMAPSRTDDSDPLGLKYGKMNRGTFDLDRPRSAPEAERTIKRSASAQRSSFSLFCDVDGEDDRFKLRGR